MKTVAVNMSATVITRDIFTTHEYCSAKFEKELEICREIKHPSIPSSVAQKIGTKIKNMDTILDKTGDMERVKKSILDNTFVGYL